MERKLAIIITLQEAFMFLDSEFQVVCVIADINTKSVAASDIFKFPLLRYMLFKIWLLKPIRLI